MVTQLRDVSKPARAGVPRGLWDQCPAVGAQGELLALPDTCRHPGVTPGPNPSNPSLNFLYFPFKAPKQCLDELVMSCPSQGSSPPDPPLAPPGLGAHSQALQGPHFSPSEIWARLSPGVRLLSSETSTNPGVPLVLGA